MAYTIKKGDTLSAIAKANNTTVAKIVAANPSITNPNVIRAGAKIEIPGKTTATTSTTTSAAPATPPAGPSGQPVVSSGISTAAGTKTDTLSMSQLQKQFGIAAAVIGADSSLKSALDKILGVGGGPMITDPALQEQIVKGTSWYRSQTDKQRSFAYAKETNPGQFAADLQTNASAIIKQFFDNGIKISAADAITYAQQMMQQSVIVDGKVISYDQKYLDGLMSKAIDFSKKSVIGGTKDAKGNYISGTIIYDLDGKLETAAKALYDTAWQYGFPATVSNERFSQWFEASLKGLTAGTLTPEQVDDELQQRAISAFPGVALRIQRGETLRQAADAQLQGLADTWEVDKDSIDLNNDYVQRALNNQNEKGEIIPMSIYETKKLARRSPDFDHTSIAKEEKTGIASRILKDFGFLA